MVLEHHQGGYERLEVPFPSYQTMVFVWEVEHNRGMIALDAEPILVVHGRSDIYPRMHNYLSTNECIPTKGNIRTEEHNKMQNDNSRSGEVLSWLP